MNDKLSIGARLTILVFALLALFFGGCSIAFLSDPYMLESFIIIPIIGLGIAFACVMGIRSILKQNK